MNASDPRQNPDLQVREPHLTDDEIICVAYGDADFLLQDRTDAHVRDCVVCRERLRFFEEIVREDEPLVPGAFAARAASEQTELERHFSGPVGVRADFPGRRWAADARLEESTASADRYHDVAWAAESAECGGNPVAVIAFAALNAEFDTLATERERVSFLAAQMDPHSRPWFRACHALVHGESAEECSPALREALSFLPAAQCEMALLHCEIARELRTNMRSIEGVAKAFEEPSKRSGLPLGLVCDIAQELLTEPGLLASIIGKAHAGGIWHGDLRPAESESQVAGVLVEKEAGFEEGKTIVVFLTLEIVSRIDAEVRSLRLYPAPAIAMWDRDADFREAEAAAAAFVEAAMPEPCIAEVRWRLTRYAVGPLPGRLNGPSLGLAFAFLLRRLFARPEETIARVRLTGVALSGAITRSGEILPVGSVLAKALHHEFFHTLLAPPQEIVHPHLEAIHDPRAAAGELQTPSAAWPAVLSTRGGEVHVLRAGDIERGAVLLEVDYQTRWQAFDFELPERQPDFVGRKKMTGKILEFIRTTESGYGVVVGGMGSGKTSFMKQLIRTVAADRWHTAFHIVPSQPGSACRGENLARKIYYQLRRTHLTPEPVEWNGWDITRKLPELLKYIGRKNAQSGEKDVILIDAVDQVELPGDLAFVPDILPVELPPGIVCIISSRSNPDLLRYREFGAEFFKIEGGNGGMPHCTDERADIREYLAEQKMYPLPQDLIDGMMKQPTPPVFFTVVKRLAELKAGTLSAERKQEYLTDAKLWVKPSEQLIERQIQHIIGTVNTDRTKEAVIWNTLGVISVVREPICEEELSGLGLWQEGFTNTILKAAASFFLPRTSGGPRHQEPFRFEHQGYPDVIVEMLKEDGRERCHRLLAEQCLGWSKLHGMARRYALRHAPAHVRRAKMWEKLYGLLTDFEYLEERMVANRVAPNDERRVADVAQHFPQRLAARVIRDLERALVGKPRFAEDHRWREAIEALHRVAEANASILHEAPELLVQQIYNELAWDWDEGTDLGKKLRCAIATSRRIVLKRRSRPAVPADRVPCVIFKGHRKAVNCVALSPDERMVATASSDTTVILWQAATGDVIHVLREHASPVRAVAWSRGGLLASLGKCVRLWNPETGACLGVLPVGDGRTAIAFSPVDETLAVGGSDGSIRLYSAGDMREIGVLRERGAKVMCIAFSSDGRLLAAGTGDAADGKGAVDLYDAGRRAHLRTLPSVRYWVETVAFAASDTMIVTGGGVNEGEVRCYDVETGKSQRTLPIHLKGILSIGMSRNGVLVTGSYDHIVGVRDLSTGAVLRTGMAHKDTVRSVAVSSDAKLVVSSSADHTVIAWKLGEFAGVTASSGAVSSARHSHEQKIHAIRFSPDGLMAITASEDGTARLFAADSTSAGPVLKVAGKAVNIAVISPDGSKVAVASHATVKIFDRATGAEIHTLLGHEDWILDIAWTPDGARIVSVSQDTKVIVWDAHTGAWLRTLQAHTARLRAVAISPDGRQAATTGDDAKIHVWDLETGQLLRTLHSHNLRLKALAYSPEGWLASAGGDDFIKIWDPLTGRELATLYCPSQEVWTLKFAPSRFLAAGGKDGQARLFDLKTGLQVASFPCADAVQALWFSADGTELRIADRGGASLIPNIHVVEIVLPARN